MSKPNTFCRKWQLTLKVLMRMVLAFRTRIQNRPSQNNQINCWITAKTMLFFKLTTKYTNLFRTDKSQRMQTVMMNNRCREKVTRTYVLRNLIKKLARTYTLRRNFRRWLNICQIEMAWLQSWISRLKATVHQSKSSSVKTTY